MFTMSPSDPGAPGKALIHDPLDSGAPGHIERSTLQMIANVFPTPTLGQVFFIRFLQRGARESSVLPDEDQETTSICTKSIATLGRELGFSNDTTQKYVVLYIALGLLKKRKVMGQLAFVMRTGIYHPPENLEANLDFLIQKETSRPKLKTMAIEVKARCRIYGLIQQDLASALEQLQVLLHIDKGTSRRTVEQRLAQAQYITSKVLKVVLTSHLSAESPQVDGTRGQKNLPRKGCSIDETEHQGNQESPQWPHASSGQGKERLTQNLPEPGSRGGSLQSLHDSESPQDGEPGRFAEEGASSRLPDEAEREVSLRYEHEGESPQHSMPGRFEEKHGSSSLPDEANQGDSMHYEQKNESPEECSLDSFPEQRASSRLLHTTGWVDSSQSDQHTRLAESTQARETGRREDDYLRSNLPNLTRRGDSGGLLRNVNVDTIYLFIITSTLRESQRVAEFLAEQLEGDRRASPKYQALFRTQNGRERDPHVLAAAFFCTMVRLHRDRWNISKRPGGFFTKRCREYDAGVPEEVEGWIKDYGHLSPAALLEALRKQAQPGQEQPTAAAPPSSSHKPAPAPLFPLLALDPSVQVESARIVMSKHEAEALIQSILHDQRTELFRTCRVRLGKTSSCYAVLVDASVPGGPPHQTLVYSQAEWQERLDRMRTWRDLVYPATSPPASIPSANSLDRPQKEHK